MSDSIFITGAAGHLGGKVIEHLLSRGVSPGLIVAGSRDPAKLASVAARGIEVREADFDDLPGLTRSFAGAATVLIVSTDTLTPEGRRQRQHRNAVDAAVAAGARRLAYTSLPEPTASPLSFAADHVRTEEALAASGLPVILFRNGWYQENLFMGLPSALKSGHWCTAAADGKTSYAARDEIAEAIAVVLANPPAGGHTYTLTGSEAFSVPEIAALARNATGRPLEVVDVTDEQFVAGLGPAGLPDFLIPVLASMEVATRSGSLGIVTGDLAGLIGRTPKPLATFFAEQAGALSR